MLLITIIPVPRLDAHDSQLPFEDTLFVNHSRIVKSSRISRMREAGTRAFLLRTATGGSEIHLGSGRSISRVALIPESPVSLHMPLPKDTSLADILVLVDILWRTIPTPVF